MICLIYILFSGKATFFIFALISLFYFFNKILIYNFSYFLRLSIIILPIFIIIFQYIDLQERLIERLLALSNLDFEMNYFDRFKLINISLNTFLNNPIIGIGYDFEEILGDISVVEKLGIGLHSELIDYLPRYGLIGMLFLIIFFYYLSNDIFDKIKEFKKILFYFLFLSIFTNTFNLESGFLIFLYFPLSSDANIKNLY